MVGEFFIPLWRWYIILCVCVCVPLPAEAAGVVSSSSRHGRVNNKKSWGVLPVRLLASFSFRNLNLLLRFKAHKII